MTELIERIREFIDTGVAPVSAEEIFVARPSVKVRTSAERVRPRLRRRLFVLSGVAGLVIAVVCVGLVMVPGAKNAGVTAASAATLLESVACKAATERPLVPGIGQYLYVATIEGMGSGTR